MPPATSGGKGCPQRILYTRKAEQDKLQIVVRTYEETGGRPAKIKPRVGGRCFPTSRRAGRAAHCRVTVPRGVSRIEVVRARWFMAVLVREVAVWLDVASRGHRRGSAPSAWKRLTAKECRASSSQQSVQASRRTARRGGPGASPTGDDEWS